MEVKQLNSIHCGVFNPTPSRRSHVGLTFILDFADMHLSLLCLPPVIPVEVDRITTRLADTVDLILAKLMGT